MSRKNHQFINGRLLQTDKRFFALKERQKEKISHWMYEETLNYWQANKSIPKGSDLVSIVDKVYSRIEEAEIWIPYFEVQKQYHSKLSVIMKRCQKHIDTEV